jgi:NTE family protein
MQTEMVSRTPRAFLPSGRAVLAVSSLGAFMAFVDATIVNIAFPDIAASFPGTAISSLSWILNAYNVAFAALLVVAGGLADLLGRRRVYLGGLAVFTVASALCAVAPTVGVLVGMRVAQAAGAALLVPSSLALVLHAHPPRERSRAVATVAVVSALAAGIGPALGGLLVEASGWRLVFLVNVPVGVLGYVLARRVLVESRKAGRRQVPDLLGAVLLAAAAAGLVLAVVKGDAWGWLSVATVGTTAASGLLTALFVRRCRTHRAPLVDPALLRHRTFVVANAASVVAAAGFFGYTLVNVLYLTDVWHYGVLAAGLAITPGPLVAIAVARPSAWLVRRAGSRVVLVLGGLLWGGAVLWFATAVHSTPSYVAQWLPGMVLLGVGAGLLFPNLSAVAVASAPGDGFAVATGLNTVARQVGAALGVAAVVAIVEAAGSDPLRVLDGFDHAWELCAGCLGAAGLACLAVGRSRPATEPAAEERTVRVPLPRPIAPAEPPRPAPRRIEPLLPDTPSWFLSSIALFAPLGDSARHTLAERSRTVRLPAGDWLLRRGERGTALYAVRSGLLEVVDEAGSVVRTVGRGGVVGELEVLSGGAWSASVRAVRRTELVAVPAADVDELLATNPAAATALCRMLACRLRDDARTARTGRPVPATIALVALDDGVPVVDLANRLTGELRRWGGHVDRLSAASDGPAFAPMLDRAVAANDQVVLVAPPGPGSAAWTDFCLRQADRIVLVGSAAAGAVGPHPPELRGCDLVTWDVVPGSGALAAWAAAVEPVSTHAVRQSTVAADVALLARRLAGRSVGVVLSGGGARAFAHIGVLAELEAAGVQVDRVGGVSTGAFVGALYATGCDPAEIEARCFDEWVRRRRPLRDLTRGTRRRAMLERSFGGVAIEELGRGCTAGAADLRTGELVVARTGLVADAVGASIAFPVLGPVVVRDGRLLVDGSLVDNLPVATMAAVGEGPVVAVDCRAHVVGRDVRPSLGETLARVLELGSTRPGAGPVADWTISPPDPGIGLLEFAQLDVAVAAGRDAARRALPAAPVSVLPR